MQLATAMNLRKAMDEETKRERFASCTAHCPESRHMKKRS